MRGCESRHRKTCSTFKKYVKFNTKYCRICKQKVKQFVPHFVKFHPDVLSDKYLRSERKEWKKKQVKVQSKNVDPDLKFGENSEVKKPSKSCKKVAQVVLVRLPDQLVHQYLGEEMLDEIETNIEPIDEDIPELD